jgi:hypothetical protein
MLYAISACRWGEDNTPVALMLAKVRSSSQPVACDEAQAVDVKQAVDLLHAGDKVQVLLGSRLGPVVRTLMRPDGTESIRDIPNVHAGQSLEDVPTF